MINRNQLWHGLLLTIAVTLAVNSTGCSSKPPRVRPINIDPATAAQRAITERDADSEGELSSEELDKAPGLKSSLGRMDSDGSGSLSSIEIENRLKAWKEQQMGVRSLKVLVTMNGKPIENADIEFTPEPFLGELAKPAFGFTNEKGVANISHDKQDMPRGAEGGRGVTNGLFRIKITQPTKSIPAKYNEQTTLGQEIAIDTINSLMRLDL